MRQEAEAIDISGFPELLRLAEEVQRTHAPRLLKRGEEEIAFLAPIRPRSKKPKRSKSVTLSPAESDSVLNIIGIGESSEPTDIARYEREYLADAYDLRR